jgi:hypothetical protein
MWIGKQYNKSKKKQGRKTLIMLILIKRLVEREFVKQQQANFIIAWSSSIIRHISLQFQNKFTSSPFWIHGCES